MKNKAVLFNSEKNCCGCSACMNICPQQAITMSYGSFGDILPTIDYHRCIGCKLCEKVCVFKHPNISLNNPTAFIYRASDEDRLKKSQSGGIAYAISELIIQKKGVVFGVEIYDGYHVKTSCAKEKSYLDRFCGSKYVQSDLNDTFIQCKKALNDGKVVLFTGTGCQIDGLLSFLKVSRIKTDNLYTLDIICHGVPGQKKWLDYISLLEKKMGSRVITTVFRDKERTGWRGQIEKYGFENGEILHLNYWSRSYQRTIAYRDACFNCKYTSVNRNSDFTVGDYWGVENYYPDLNDNKGVSIVLAHTPKAMALLSEISSDFLYKSEIKEIMQPCLEKRITKKPLHEVFKMIYKISPKISMRLFIFPSFITSFMSKIGNKNNRFRKR